MILRITDSIENNESLNVMKMPISEFCDIHSQPWIATQNFEFIVIDLDKRITSGFINAMASKLLVVPKIIGPNDKDVIRLLIEIYPNEAAKLRYTFIRNRNEIDEVIKELATKYEWEYYYKFA